MNCKTILSLAGLNEVLEDDVKAGLRKDGSSKRYHSVLHAWLIFRLLTFFRHRVPTTENVGEILTRGKTLWQSIYTPHDEKLYNKLGSYHPDFIGSS